MRSLILKSSLSPGDIITMTAAVRDLHAAYPGEFVTDVRTPCPELWENNPHVTKLDAGEELDLHYPLINESNQKAVHFIDGYREYLASLIGKPIARGPFKGDIHLSDEERNWLPQVEGDYWIVVAGGKLDFTNKWWSYKRWQDVVNQLQSKVKFVQVGESSHVHPALDNVLDLRGKTDLRQLVRLVYHSKGVICPVTSLMHLAAAVPTKDGSLRPCVVVAGGREPVHWEQYPGHTFLHTIGKLPCCATGGCWKSRVQPLRDGSEQNKSLCEYPTAVGEQVIPACMERITSDDVVRAVESYLLPPPQKQTGCCGAAKNLFKAATRAVTVLARNGTVKVSDEELKKRRALCAKCEYLLPATALVGPRCSKCSCIVKAKTMLTTESCPIGKWERTDTVKSAAPKPLGPVKKAEPGPILKVKFHHGLGDHAHFAANIALAIQDGYKVVVNTGADKAPLLEAAGAEVTADDSGEDVPWHDLYWGRTVERQVPLWEYNKSAVNLSHPPMPVLSGTSEEQWERFKSVRLGTDRLSIETKRKIGQLIKDLPRPIITLHTIGNSWQEVKTLPEQTTLDLYNQLLDRTNGSIIILDWDNRVPRLAGWRVRHQQQDWGGLNLAELMVLLSRVDLHVGVDSGPLHVAGIMGTPTVAVWPHPDVQFSKYLVPRPNQVSVVSDRQREWNRNVRHEYGIREFSGEVTGKSIADAAVALLNPRYGLKPGVDAMMQQWVLEWQRTPPAASPLSYRGDRDKTFDIVLKHLSELHNPILVETGCIRAPEDWGGAGYSTYLLSRFVHEHGGELHSFDIDRRNVEFARNDTERMRNTQIHLDDSVTGLKSMHATPDFILLDSWDTYVPGYAEHALREAEAAHDMTRPGALLLLDDTVHCDGVWHGKGKTAVPWLLEHGWSIVYSGLQTLLRK